MLNALHIATMCRASYIIQQFKMVYSSSLAAFFDFFFVFLDFLAFLA